MVRMDWLLIIVFRIEIAICSIDHLQSCTDAYYHVSPEKWITRHRPISIEKSISNRPALPHRIDLYFMVVSNVGCEFENIIYARNANEIRFDHVPTLRHMSISSNNIFDVACLFSRASTVMCQVKFTFLIYFFPIAQAVLRRHSRHFLYTPQAD